VSLNLAQPTTRESKPLRILDFDTEVRPLSYLGSDYTTGEVTGIATAWILDGVATDVEVYLLGDPALGDDVREQGATMLESFRARYDEADIVTGHFIRGYDLPVLNGSMLDNGYGPLSDKRTHCTKADLIRRKYVSASQENLGALLGQLLDEGVLDVPEARDYWRYLDDKVQMNTPRWRTANRLTPEGIELTRERVAGDVKQHAQLRDLLMRMGWLDSTTVWRSAGSHSGAYVP